MDIVPTPRQPTKDQGQHKTNEDRGSPPTKHEAIIEAATSCFLAHGYIATSMDRVAADAGVAKQTLYHHFGSKNGLFEATLQHVTGQLTQVLGEQETAGQNPANTLLQFGTDILELSLRPQSVAFMRLLISEAGKHKGVIDSLVRRAFDGITDNLARYLDDQAIRRTLKVDHPRHAAQTFLGMLAGELRLRALLGALPDMDRKARAKHVDMTVQTFLRAFSP